MRVGLFALALLLLAPGRAAAEWQAKPFLGFAFGGETTFLDLDDGVARRHSTIGGSLVWLGEVVGVEGDFGTTSGFFQSGSDGLVLGSRVSTFTGNVVIALPRRIAEYTLRPYLVAGGGWMRVRSRNKRDALSIESDLAAIDVGGGVTGFLTPNVGVGWDLRYFRSVGGEDRQIGISRGRPEEFSFWRASMALVIRY